MMMQHLLLDAAKNYKTYGWQVTTGTAEEKEQARFVSSFLDIYNNSFSQ